MPRAEESWLVPHLSLPQGKFSERQKEAHLCSGTGKGGALEQGGERQEASMGNCGQGLDKNEKSVSRNRRCQLESADLNVEGKKCPEDCSAMNGFLQTGGGTGTDTREGFTIPLTQSQRAQCHTAPRPGPWPSTLRIAMVPSIYADNIHYYLVITPLLGT